MAKDNGGDLRSVLGERKIPLAYIIRKDPSVPTDDTILYPTKQQDEMIARAPHFSLGVDGNRVPDPICLANNEKVWEIISRLTRELPS